MKAIKSFLLLGAVAFVLSGCGGSGSDSGSGTGSVNTFITDSLSANDQVWSRIHEIELVSATGSVKIFEDADGQTVNLRALRDANGARFSLFSMKSIPAGTYTGAIVKLAKSLTIMPPGNPVGESKVFEDSFDDSPNRSRVAISFATPLVVNAGSQDVILDFDLANWTDNAGKITPVIRKIDDSTVSNPARHQGLRYTGTTSALGGVAPNRMFTLTTRTGAVLLVQMSSTTRIFNDDAVPNPNLANGQRVDVFGVFDKATSAIKASAVKIKLGEDGPTPTPEIHGIASFDLPSSDGSFFKVNITSATHFLPNAKLVTVSTTANTVFRANNGSVISSIDFYDALALALGVEVEGAYNSATMTMTATKVKLDDEFDDEGEAEARGAATSINATAGTFKLTLQEWEGFSGTGGTSIDVTVTPSATFEDQMGETIDRAQFFQAISNGVRAKVKGTFANGVFTTSRCELRSSN